MLVLHGLCSLASLTLQNRKPAWAVQHIPKQGIKASNICSLCKVQMVEVEKPTVVHKQLGRVSSRTMLTGLGGVCHSTVTTVYCYKQRASSWIAFGKPNGSRLVQVLFLARGPWLILKCSSWLPKNPHWAQDCAAQETSDPRGNCEDSSKGAGLTLFLASFFFITKCNMDFP